MKIVFVHIPKAAGTSLKKAMTDRVGTENMYFDYQRPLEKGDLHRQFDCLLASVTAKPRPEPYVFGHFLAGKYGDFNGRHFTKRKEHAYVTFLRDPLQRAISHYFFWKRTNVAGHRVWERFVREDWSMERFLLSREHTNFQAKFLWRFPLTQFDFIGLTEHFDDSLKMLGCAFPALKDLPVKAENNNPANSLGATYRIDQTLAAEFVARNKLDYALYNQAHEIFLEQRRRFLIDEAAV